MIVYGDPQFRVSLQPFVRRLAELSQQAANAASQRHPEHSSALQMAAMRLLIACGQCEQGVEDDSARYVNECRAAIRRVTDLAAAMYVDFLAPAARSPDRAPGDFRQALDRFASIAPGATLTVKVPEGYAFYLLAPQQYVLATQQWLAERSGDAAASVAVVGLRSIGTSLSAVVAAALRQDERVAAVRRATVRPHGHPFARETALPDELRAAPDAENSSWALVVDEGPGLSGSSMAAAYAALAAEGRFSPERIAFLPGHSSLPGGQGSDEVRRVWSSVRRYVAQPSEILWEGLTLQSLLSNRSREVAGAPSAEADSNLHDIGGGNWRGFAYPAGEEGEWPVVAAQFERPKYLWKSPAGGAMIWTFAGFSEMPGPDGAIVSRDEAAVQRVNALAMLGWTMPVIAIAAGFVASEWIDGARLRSGDAERDAEIVPMLARYCADASLLPLGEETARASWERLREMLICNARECLGEASAEIASTLAETAWSDAEASFAAVAAYGDGRMAPHEWVRRMSDGRILKTDCAGHELDHTIVGAQPVWWDLAGASIEWQLNSRRRSALWRCAQAKLGMNQHQLVAAGSAVERFYRASYAAFRLGALALGDPSRGASQDKSAETARRERAVLLYSRALADALRA